MALFPSFHLFTILASICLGILRPGLPAVSLTLFCAYLFPPMVFFVHNRLYPLTDGREILSDKKSYSPWWGSHQIQLIYIALPFLESTLRIIPGLYSAWLRLWGAQIGRGVHWTPTVTLADRGMLKIGDGVVFGHRSELYGHLIKPGRNGKLTNFTGAITIGSGSFVSGYVRIGPGVTVEANSFIPGDTDVSPFSRWSAGAEASRK